MINSGRSAIRSVIVMLALFALAVTGAVTVTSTAAVAAGGVEDSGAGCPVSLPGSLTANSMLPDPFTRLNGTRISSLSDWTCRPDSHKRAKREKRDWRGRKKGRRPRERRHQSRNSTSGSGIRDRRPLSSWIRS